jgi:cation transport regulator
MPYASTRDLPDPVRHVLPAHAQDIYKEAFNHAWDEYDDPGERRGDESREEVAHKVAWSAVKGKYEKGDDGRWHARHG